MRRMEIGQSRSTVAERELPLLEVCRHVNIAAPCDQHPLHGLQLGCSGRDPYGLSRQPPISLGQLIGSSELPNCQLRVGSSIQMRATVRSTDHLRRNSSHHGRQPTAAWASLRAMPEQKAEVSAGRRRTMQELRQGRCRVSVAGEDDARRVSGAVGIATCAQ